MGGVLFSGLQGVYHPAGRYGVEHLLCLTAQTTSDVLIGLLDLILEILLGGYRIGSFEVIEAERLRRVCIVLEIGQTAAQFDISFRRGRFVVDFLVLDSALREHIPGLVERLPDLAAEVIGTRLVDGVVDFLPLGLIARGKFTRDLRHLFYPSRRTVALSAALALFPHTGTIHILT